MRWAGYTVCCDMHRWTALSLQPTHSFGCYINRSRADTFVSKWYQCLSFVCRLCSLSDLITALTVPQVGRDYSVLIRVQCAYAYNCAYSYKNRLCHAFPVPDNSSPAFSTLAFSAPPLVRWCKMGLLTAPNVKNFNFKNPRWRRVAILKTVNWLYLCKLLTDFAEIWHNDAYWSPAVDVKFIFFNFRQSYYMADSRYLKNRKNCLNFLL